MTSKTKLWCDRVDPSSIGHLIGQVQGPHQHRLVPQHTRLDKPGAYHRSEGLLAGRHLSGHQPKALVQSPRDLHDERPDLLLSLGEVSPRGREVLHPRLPPQHEVQLPQRARLARSERRCHGSAQRHYGDL